MPDSALTGKKAPTSRWWRDARRRRFLAYADVFAGLLAIALSPMLSDPLPELILAIPVILVVAKLSGLYDLDHRKVRHLTVDELSPIAVWAGSSMLILGLVWSLLNDTPVRLGAVAIAFALAIGLATLFRAAARHLWRRCTPPEATMVVGGGELRNMIERKVELFPDMHLALVQHGHTRAAPTKDSVLELQLEGVKAQREIQGISEYRDALNSLADRVDRLIVAHDVIDPPIVGELVGICRAKQVKLSVVSPLSGRAQPPAMTRVAELPVMEYDTSDVSRSTRLVKRVFDVIVSAVGLVILSPLMLLIALAIKLDSRGPVLFVHRRAGLFGEPFSMLKFRSMSSDAEERLADVVQLDSLADPMFKLERDPRVTRVGRWIRRTSLDELPQLINVLRGDMSVVGPRPEELQVVARYRPEHLFRLDVKPGLTGPMQVFGRGALTFSERLAVEFDYIENASFGRDLRILCLTLPAVGRGTGAY